MPYSQNNEEEIILAELARMQVQTGRFLDIGAYDPKAFSNSRALIEAGWSAVLVEPSPKPFLALIEAYSQNEKIQLVHAAVSPFKSSLVPWYDSSGDAISTTSPAHKTKWEQGWKVKYVPCWVYMMPLGTLFDAFGFDFEMINIDVESTNIELFRALPWASLAKTRILCVEHDSYFQEMTEIAARHGFTPLALNGENLLLSRK